MGQEIYWIYAFNVIVNSFLSFFTALFLVELFVYLLRVKHPRIKAICCFLPFVKICLDFFLYHFSHWALLKGINPLLAERGTRQLSLMVNPWMGIRLNLHDGQTFSVADVIALSVDPLWIKAIVSLAAIGMIFSCARIWIRIARDKKHMGHILKSASLIQLLKAKPVLAAWIQKKGVRLVLASDINAPCIAGKTILFPAHLSDELSTEEYEAVIAHEMAHLQWQDRSMRIVYTMVAAVFWWIPSRRWQRRIDEMQEKACDYLIHRFGISKFALAEAILKTAQKTRAAPSRLVCSFVERPSSLKSRMQMILQGPVPQARAWKAIQYGLLGVVLLSILWGKLWIF